MPRIIIGLGALVLLSGCVQPYNGPVIRPVGPSFATQDQTAGVEEQDRINRFRRLSNMQGIAQPEVEQLMLPPGSVDFMLGPVPVVRVVFSERAFFAFNSATPLPSSEAILNVIAENMKHDVPDAALTVLGHTDGVGSDSYNIELSRRRAEAVMAALVARGVKPDQLSEVAIGKRQPIAPNSTIEGRALNRRVEFLVSPALSPI
jgi:outer membrane protein OmpA-like peptidoglycan-associated protein